MHFNIKQFVKNNFYSVLFIFLAFALMGAVSFRFASSIVNRQMKVIGEEIMNTTQITVSSNLSETQLAFLNMSQTIDSMRLSGKSGAEILSFLEYLNDNFSKEGSSLTDFMKIYAYIDDEFLDGSGWVPPSDYDPPKRPWYIGALMTEDVYFTEPYLDADTGDTCISFSKVIAGSDETADVLAIDLNLSRITDYMENQKLANNGYGLVLDDTLHVVGHPKDELVGRRLTDINNGYARLAGMLQSGQEVSAERFTNYKGIDSIAFFRPIFNGWYLGVVTPRSSYFSQVHQLAWVLGIVGLFSAAILTVILLRTRFETMKSIEESNSKSAFLSRMSHEMRTPMNAIIGMTTISKGTSDVKQLRKCIDKIDVAANHLLGVINDVLDISKIESGKFELAEAEFVTEDMIRHVTSVISHNVADKKLHFSVHLAPNIPYAIISDEQRLAQVITNLLSNAVKFTPEQGQVTLAVRMAEQNGDSCVLAVDVTDTGIGIDEEQISKLFQSFEQADNTISRRYGGTGLGLAISKSIVEKMGGSIGVESTPGTGSRFYFTVRVGCGTIKKIELSQQVPWNSLKVLVVDSEPEILAFMEEFAQKIGLTCRKASDGPEALRVLARDEQFDVVLIDLDLKGISGLDLAREVIDGYRGTTVVMIAAMSEWKELAAEAIPQEIHSVIEKPLFTSSLVDWFTEHFTARQPRQNGDGNSGASNRNIFAGRRILAAEDMEINREVLLSLLRDTGVEIEYAENGVQAVEKFEADPDRYDLVFMDIHMPDMDGYEATRRIRASAQQRGRIIPIVAMTANAFQEDIDRCLEAGMNDHIGKPINVAEVISKMKRYL